MSNERISSNKAENEKPSLELESIRREVQENIDSKNRHESESKSHEHSKAEQLDEARHDALEATKKHEKEISTEKKEESPAERRRGPITKQERKAAFNKTMKEVQSEMSPASRTFSKVIHNPVVEKTSEVVGSTVARPNAILSGSVAAFITTTIIYLVARHYGYQLSGTETIAAFILGWVLGIIYDYFRVLIFGKEK